MGTLRMLLSFRGHGHAIVLCVGGAREALLAKQDQFQIVLGRRLVKSDTFMCCSWGTVYVQLNDTDHTRNAPSCMRLLPAVLFCTYW